MDITKAAGGGEEEAEEKKGDFKGPRIDALIGSAEGE